MKQILLIISAILLLHVLNYAQTPEITVSTSTISGVLTEGDTTFVTFSIHNSGTANLNWDMEIIGNSTTFTKDNFDDWTLPENQDIITPQVKITRQDQQGLFNIAKENEYGPTTPGGTEWCFGKTSELSPEDYVYWIEAVNHNPQSMVNNIISLHLIEEGLYYDVLCHSFSGGVVAGGGFSYTRTEIPQWLYTSPINGITNPGGEQRITVVLDSRSIKKGVKNCKIKINSNDPSDPVILIDVQLTVVGIPAIVLSKSSLNFDTTIVGNTNSLQVKITNIGSETLEISNLPDTLGCFNFSIGDTIIGEGLFENLNVNFSPTSEQLYTDTLTFNTNIPSSPIIKIPLTGVGLLVPKIEVLPGSINHIIDEGPTDTVEFVITNSGNKDLTWYCLIEFDNTQTFTYSKNGFADWTIPQNQDRISENIWITRASNKGIFNIAQESGYVAQVSPIGTEWAIGNTGTVLPENYTDWETAINNNPVAALKKPLSLKLSDENLYYDIIFHTWTSSDQGGGLSYTRTFSQQWLKLSDYTDTTLIANSDTVDVIFNTSGLEKGIYNASIIIWTNDPVHPKIYVPVTFQYGGTLVQNHLPDIILNEQFETHSIELGNVFNDAQDDTLSYTTLSSAPLIVTTEIVGSELIISETGIGISTIVVTASDEYGNFAIDSFNLRVNDIPEINLPISDKIINEGFITDTISISEVFIDSDLLVYTAQSNNSNIATVEIIESNLLIHEVGNGTIIITLSASDGIAPIVANAFSYRINSLPIINNPIDDITINEGFETYEIELSDVFFDADTDNLEISATNSNSSVISIAILDSKIVVTEAGLGYSDITITAGDGFGIYVEDEFRFTVSDIVDIDINKIENSVKIFPNPNNGIFVVELPENSQSVLIYNSLGELVYRNEEKSSGNSIKIDLTRHGKGIYSIRILDKANKTYTVQFTVN